MDITLSYTFQDATKTLDIIDSLLCLTLTADGESHSIGYRLNLEDKAKLIEALSSQEVLLTPQHMGYSEEDFIGNPANELKKAEP